MMEEETTDQRPVTYTCVATGQAIPLADVDGATDLVLMDEGAEVRICREHGAPVAITFSPPFSD